MQIRFQFHRGEALKCIGHLDILRLFERTFRRMALPVAYSKGFNPRPQIVFAQPMPLGLTSEGEFADVEFMEPMHPEEFQERTNQGLPPGIGIIKAQEKTNPSNIMGLIDAAQYRIEFEASDAFEMELVIDKLMNSSAIQVVKKTKSGQKEMNIRPFIYNVTGAIQDKKGYFIVMLGAGQHNNIRPELFLSGVWRITGMTFEMEKMHRIMLYHQNKNTDASNNRWMTLMHDALL